MEISDNCINLEKLVNDYVDDSIDNINDSIFTDNIIIM